MTIKHKLASLTLTGVLALAAAGPAQAKHGADDGAKHHKRHHHHKHHHHHGNDDGANHT